MSELKHYGIKRRSGRYPWGSGKNPMQRAQDFKAYVDEMTDKGLSQTDIADAIQEYARAHGADPHFKFSSNDLRQHIAISTEQIREQNIARAVALKADNNSNVAIAKIMNTGEATVRGWLKMYEEQKSGIIRSTAEALKEHVADKEFLDVGKGNNLYMGISYTRFKNALALLKDEGYEVHEVKVPQLHGDKMTTTNVLCKEGTSWHDARAAVVDGRLKLITAQSDDGGLTFRTPKDLPVSVSSKRIDVRYDEDGGTKMDGVIELRRGVPELSLGGKRYGQVRIAVDGTHYLKGMAMYADDLPAGMDIRFNTNKKKTDPKILKEGKLGAMKPMKTDQDGNVDPSNPFGASVRPKLYTDKNGKEKTSPLNMVNEEGAWDAWSKNLSSQMLSKQSITLARQQLGIAEKDKRKELDEILSLTNPVVKEKLLMEFADSADAAAVHLKAAKMPRQATSVILPVNAMRPHEIYAPNFENGEKVVLVRHPHGGPFEIPELTVNNHNRTAQRILKGAQDAVGIHHSVAEQLSGADFDGDTVLVIPNDGGKVKTRPPLQGLQGFDAKEQYRIPEGDTTTKRMTKQTTQTEMGRISNLITDMTIHGASDADLVRAVRHSMVVIDAEKHGLDYKRSEQENGIASLKKTYQKGANKGASTLISRASSDKRIPQVKQPSGKAGIDPVTGEKILVPTNKSYDRPKLDRKTGQPTGETEKVFKTTKGTKMGFAKDARELSSGTPMEEVYASHANSMKAMANEARRNAVAITPPRHSAAAKAVYSKEVASLDAKLKLALRNAPLERRAQVLGNAMARDRIDANPALDKDDIKKIKYQSQEEAREITGANKKRIGSEESPLTDREWEAIQAGAISATTLREIMANANMDRIKELSTPRYRGSLTPGQLARMKSMAASNRTPSEIADALGLPRSTVVDNLANT